MGRSVVGRDQIDCGGFAFPLGQPKLDSTIMSKAANPANQWLLDAMESEITCRCGSHCVAFVAKYRNEGTGAFLRCKDCGYEFQLKPKEAPKHIELSKSD